MRRPRNFDAELKVLDKKAKALRQRKLTHLGELVVVTGADALPIEMLAGALLAALDTSDLMRREEWRARGAAFFQRGQRKAGKGFRHQSNGNKTVGGGAESPGGASGT